MSKLKNLTKPGNHHWLNWPITCLSILFIYGLYTGISGTSIGLAERHHIMSANIGLLILVIYTAVIMVLVYRWQTHHLTLQFNWKKWLKYWGWSVIAIWVSNVGTNLLFHPFLHQAHQIGSNQQDLMNAFFTPGPIQTWTILATTIVAPFFEEFVFRFNLIGPKEITHPIKFKSNHRKLYAIISIILFTYLHVMDDVNTVVVHYSNQMALSLIHSIIVYTLTGIILTNAYLKSNDIRYSFSIHMTWNLISLLPLLILLIFK